MNKLRRYLNFGLLTSLPGVPFVNSLLVTHAHATGIANVDSADVKARALDSDFAALIDTFVPADEAPGAIDQGIHLPLLARIRANQEYLNTIVKMFDDLNTLTLEHYEVRFEAASLAQRTAVVLKILNSDARYKDASTQISSLRISTLSGFYSSEAAFEMLDYHPPSQGGYPDYARPPV